MNSGNKVNKLLLVLSILRHSEFISESHRNFVTENLKQVPQRGPSDRLTV